MGHVPVAAHGVVEQHAAAHIGAFPHPVRDREQERNRSDEVRAESAEQQGPLAQRLVDQGHVELLEVAQSAVDQFAGPAGGAGGEIAGLDERHGQPAGGRVERDPGTGHATADDDDVDHLGLHPAQRVGAGGRVQPCRIDHRVPRFRSMDARRGADTSHRARRK